MEEANKLLELTRGLEHRVTRYRAYAGRNTTVILDLFPAHFRLTTLLYKFMNPCGGTLSLSTAPTTFEARVKWAINNRQVYTFNDTVELNVSVPKVATDDDEEEIGDIQKKYERRYRLKKEEKAKALEEEKKKELERRMEEERKKEMEKRMEEAKRREMEAQKALEKTKEEKEKLQNNVKSSISGSSQLKRKSDNNDTTAPPSKVSKSATKSTQRYGHRYYPPCDQCEDRDIACHKQIPVQNSCYACNKANIICSFPKKNYREGKSPSSSSEEVLPVSTNLRRSARLNSDSVTENLQSLNDKFSTLITTIESMHTTIRTGFDNFHRTLMQLGEITHLSDNTNTSSTIDNTNQVQDVLKTSAVGKVSVNGKME
ncbi:hypothetical protein Clacol_010204 [Clathrus columnatus]|uniref:Zn(2)-C6 fungal-type domain-containing protein n=1 Tax=Clathrus columnatus TaxID=1419009 RepID=A0AAV5AVM4_9AGAM|nr:hypothetical protein Clacol_010204 [Clathrus columnatus]